MRMTPAEIIDKASILQVKMRELPNGKKLEPQFAECMAHLKPYPQDRVAHYLAELVRINSDQWHSNERMFKALDGPLPTEFGPAVAIVSDLKRSHDMNKERVKLKNAINAEFGAGEREEKSFAYSL